MQIVFKISLFILFLLDSICAIQKVLDFAKNNFADALSIGICQSICGIFENCIAGCFSIETSSDISKWDIEILSDEIYTQTQNDTL